jgi:predicted anti-sigma-YlaC factor YlaD
MCDEVRLALSAGMDGEPTDPGVEAHLESCAACTAWRERAEKVTRAVRIGPARVPDLTDSIMATVAADPVARATRARLSARADAYARWQILRMAVAVAATVQLALAVPMLVAVFLGTETGTHAGREMASFDAAVAVGFLLAAWRPSRARAYVPVAIVLSACLAVTSGGDVIRGVTAVPHEVGHLVTLVQAGLLWALSRADRSLGGRRTKPGTIDAPRWAS